MDNEELMAIKLGFESAEEMEKYYDLCRGQFKEGILMTKELCAKHIIDNEREHLLNAPREDRLATKLVDDFCGLVESVRVGDYETEQEVKSLIDFELTELRKCNKIKNQRKV